MKTILFVDFLKESGTTTGLLTQLRQMKRRYRKSYDNIVVGSSGSLLAKYDKAFSYTWRSTDTATDFHGFWNNPLHELIAYTRTLFFVYKIARTTQPSIIHCYHYMWSMYAVPVGMVLGIPVVIHLKDVWLPSSWFVRMWMRPWKKGWYIAVSDYVKNLFVCQYNLIPARRTVRIYDGVDEKVFYSVSKDQARKKFFAQRKMCIMVSRIAPERSVEVFIDMAAILNKKIPSMRFVHYGYVPKRTDISYYRALIDRIRTNHLEKVLMMHSYVKDQRVLASIYRNAYVTIVPAIQFALPNVVIESKLSGTPTVSYATGGTSEIYQDAASRLLLQNNTPREFADVVEQLVKNNQLYLSHAYNERKFIVQRFSSSIRCDDIIRFYESLM